MLQAQTYLAFTSYNLSIYNKLLQDTEQTLERHAVLPYPAGVEMASMFQFYQTGVERSVEITKKLNPKVCSFDTFVQNHKKELTSL